MIRYELTSDYLVEILRSRPDARGECEECHRDGIDVWNYEDWVGGGDWQLCRDCLTRIRRARYQKERGQ